MLMTSRIVQRYTDFEYLRSIVVVWNNVNVKPPTLNQTWFRIPVTIVKQAKKSMNNRFKPSRYGTSVTLMTHTAIDDS